MRTRKKLGIAAALVASASLIGGALGAGPAGAAVSINVHPYVFGILGVGATDPGDPDSELCLVIAEDPPAYQGEVNGVVQGDGNNLNVNIVAQDQVTPLPTCVLTPISFTTDDTTTVATPSTSSAGGGSIQIGATTSLQSGIQATGQTYLRFDYQSGQTVKLPAGAAVVDGALTGAGTVTLALKPFLTKQKSVLDLNACRDGHYRIQTADIDSPPGGTVEFPSVVDGGVNQPSPKAWETDDPEAPTLNDSNSYGATIRTCAQSTAPVAGKLIKNKVSIVGDGQVDVYFVKAATVNPQVWDGTRGKTCSAVKTAGTLGDVVESTRILACKGFYGVPIPFAIDVRGMDNPGPPTDDPYGLLHPSDPTFLFGDDFI